MMTSGVAGKGSCKLLAGGPESTQTPLLRTYF